MHYKSRLFVLALVFAAASLQGCVSEAGIDEEIPGEVSAADDALTAAPNCNLLNTLRSFNVPDARSAEHMFFVSGYSTQGTLRNVQVVVGQEWVVDV